MEQAETMELSHPHKPLTTANTPTAALAAAIKQIEGGQSIGENAKCHFHHSSLNEATLRHSKLRQRLALVPCS